jgi:hypothetical protein
VQTLAGILYLKKTLGVNIGGRDDIINTENKGTRY